MSRLLTPDGDQAMSWPERTRIDRARANAREARERAESARMAAEFLAQSEQDNALRRLYAAEVPSPPPVGPAQTPWSSPRPARDTIVLRVRLERSRSEALRHQRLAIAHTLNAESLEDAARRADPQPSAYQHSLTSGILPAIPLIGAASYFDRADQAYDNAADEWAKAEREWRDMAAIWEAPI